MPRLRTSNCATPSIRRRGRGRGFEYIDVLGTLLFRIWIDYVADYKSPTSALTTLLVLTGYFLMLSSVFLVCAQLDELLRVKTRGRARSGAEIVRAVRRWRYAR